ncbi:ComEA family DNA-binding protein [Galbibacter pacificus]|uniref:Helix-hairpin-helix domain-containing protein n=1 Tax=Galbibacter pacificus TaxID=2996052 RepID=A0ABT6FVR1_9FLAO|nr:helix-hairpin-helix domain-containing protein [Galbibacter pacificus]MDG3583747.1 helix-hairpin-helix domain-containing protein [Galbibacter pacificus]MDG3587335.1 helix-hairpin-helix domain-containing protein [Galbibacter pacificus]
MKFISHLRFSKSQQSGIFFLIIIVASFYMGSFGMDSFKYEFYKINKTGLTSFEENTIKYHQKIFPFNPNYLTDYKAYALGMSIEEIDKLHAYRNHGRYVNSPAVSFKTPKKDINGATVQDLKKVYGIGGKLAARIIKYRNLLGGVILKINSMKFMG